jgi:hypothetical protein
MTDLNEQNDFSDTLTYSDSDDDLIFEDLEITPLANLADFADDTSENYLFDMESGGINPEDTTGVTTDGALGASNNDLDAAYYGETVYGTRVWGTPNADLDYWRYQDGDATCTVVAQISVYESITGEYISEASAADYAEAQGWFDPEAGTPTEYSGNILNDLGIEAEQSYDNTIDDITNALYYGDKVIASVDASEIWDPEYSSITGEPYEQPDLGHAVWITGVQQYSDNSIDFVLNDSGTIDGQGELVDYWDFMNAWEDRDYSLTIADV